jgi:hypothetical protein
MGQVIGRAVLGQHEYHRVKANAGALAFHFFGPLCR